VIAGRDLEIGGRAAVRLELGKPRRMRGHTDYYCPFRISGLGRTRTSYACGVDPIQAIQLALQKAAVILTTSAEARGGQLTWLGERGDFGLPLPASLRSGKT